MTDLPDKEPTFDFVRTFREMRLQTDTATAVVLGSRVEDWLQAAIKTKMRDNLSSRLTERLFKGYGPLSTFSGKIDIGYAFSMFDDKIYNDLRAIKDIRNEFAHSKSFINFQSDQLRPLLQKLTGWSMQSDPSDIFIVRCKVCVESFKGHLESAALVEAVKIIAAKHATSPDKSPEPHLRHPTALDGNEAGG